MAEIIQQKTPAAILAKLNADTAEYVLEQTGDTLDFTNADGAALINEATAGYLADVYEEFDETASDLVPGPGSSHLDSMLALLGLTRKDGETDLAFWDRRLLTLQQASLASEDALRILALSIDGVADVSFTTQADGSNNVNLVSTFPPDTNDREGDPPAALRILVGNALNASNVKHVGDTFSVQATKGRPYGIYVKVFYYPLNGHTEHLLAFQERVKRAAQDFVVARRRLGKGITQSNLYTALEIDGVAYVDGDLYVGPLINRYRMEKLSPADSTGFFTCPAASVNVVAKRAAGTQGEINLTFRALT